MRLGEGRPTDRAERELYEGIWRRHTSRAPFSGKPIPDPVALSLERAAGAEFTALRLLNVGDAVVVPSER